jgi:Tfp pilus assembly protein PilV
MPFLGVHFPRLLPTRSRAAAGNMSSVRGMTLVEVVTAIGVIGIVSTSLIAASMLTRRLTEIAVYQASVTAIMQGYLEQIKNMPFESLPFSPPAGTSMSSGTYATTYTLATQRDDVTADRLILSPLAALTTANLAPPTIPTTVYDNTKTFDVNRANDLTLHIWVWIEDLTPTGYSPAQQAKAITLLYMWQIQDGRTTRSFTGVIKNLRSLVPTH